MLNTTRVQMNDLPIAPVNLSSDLEFKFPRLVLRQSSCEQLPAPVYKVSHHLANCLELVCFSFLNKIKCILKTHWNMDLNVS